MGPKALGKNDPFAALRQATADVVRDQTLGGPQPEELIADADGDGVSDETEAWLGTSNLTDESGVDGRTDAGGVASLERVHQALEGAAQQASEAAPSLGSNTAQSGLLNATPSFEGSSVSARCLALLRG